MSSCELEGVEGTSPTLGNQASEVYLTTENIEQTIHQFNFARFIRIMNNHNKKVYFQRHLISKYHYYVKKIFAVECLKITAAKLISRVHKESNKIMETMKRKFKEREEKEKGGSCSL